METEECVNSGFYLEHRMDGNFDNTSETEEEAAYLGEGSIDFRFELTNLDKLVGQKSHIKLELEIMIWKLKEIRADKTDLEDTYLDIIGFGSEGKNTEGAYWLRKKQKQDGSPVQEYSAYYDKIQDSTLKDKCISKSNGALGDGEGRVTFSTAETSGVTVCSVAGVLQSIFRAVNDYQFHCN